MSDIEYLFRKIEYMKQILQFILALAALAFISCEKEGGLVFSNASIIDGKMEMHAGEMIYLEVSGVEGELQWNSSDPSVVSVDNGYITALSQGEAIVNAKYKNKTASVSIKVVANLVESLTMQKKVTVMYKQSLVVPITGIRPEIASPYDVKWIQEGKGVVEITPVKEGLSVLGLQEGEDFIIARNINGDDLGTLEVTVVGLTGLRIDKNELRLRNGQSEDVRIWQDPEPIYDVVWGSSDSDIAKVSGAGSGATITAGKKSGTAIITAIAGPHSISCTVSVLGDDYSPVMYVIPDTFYNGYYESGEKNPVELADGGVYNFPKAGRRFIYGYENNSDVITLFPGIKEVGELSEEDANEFGAKWSSTQGDWFNTMGVYKKKIAGMKVDFTEEVTLSYKNGSKCTIVLKDEATRAKIEFITVKNGYPSFSRSFKDVPLSNDAVLALVQRSTFSADQLFMISMRGDERFGWVVGSNITSSDESVAQVKGDYFKVLKSGSTTFTLYKDTAKTKPYGWFIVRFI